MKVISKLILAIATLQAVCFGSIPTGDSGSSSENLLKVHRELGFFAGQEQVLNGPTNQAGVSGPSSSNAVSCVQLGYAYLSKAVRLRDETSGASPTDITNCFRLAELQFRRAAELDKTNCVPFLGQSAVCHEQGRENDAVQFTEKAVACEPACWQAWFCRGMALEWIWQPQAAAESYRKAISLDANKPSTYVNLAPMPLRKWNSCKQRD